jgi:hypothetical protein
MLINNAPHKGLATYSAGPPYTYRLSSPIIDANDLPIKKPPLGAVKKQTLACHGVTTDIKQFIQPAIEQPFTYPAN